MPISVKANVGATVLQAQVVRAPKLFRIALRPTLIRATIGENVKAGSSFVKEVRTRVTSEGVKVDLIV